MCRKITSMVLVVCMLFGGVLTTNAKEEKSDCFITTPTEIADTSIIEYGDSSIEIVSDNPCYVTSVKEEIVIQDIALALYSTYDNPEEALSQICVDCRDMIAVLDETYNIGEFSDATWEAYQGALNKYISENSVKDELAEQYIDLIGFFDIYENTEANSLLKEKISEKGSIEAVLEDNNIMAMLPCYVVSDLKKEYCVENTELASVNTTYAYSSSSAITYATNYAVNPNSAYPYHQGGDCANFASQILYVGGKAQTATWYSYKQSGTWYQSYAWKDASGFAYAHGVDNSYSSFSAFSQQLSPGNFICFDSQGDGEWDHVGFVVAVASSYNSSLGYKNFRVAQHTSNYLAWVSEDSNNWDSFIDRANCELGIIRI